MRIRYTRRNGEVIECEYRTDKTDYRYELQEGEHWVSTSKDESKDGATHHFVVNANGEIKAGFGGKFTVSKIDDTLKQEFAKALKTKKAKTVESFLNKLPNGSVIKSHWYEGEKVADVLIHKDGNIWKLNNFYILTPKSASGSLLNAMKLGELELVKVGGETKTTSTVVKVSTSKLSKDSGIGGALGEHFEAVQKAIENANPIAKQIFDKYLNDVRVASTTTKGAYCSYDKGDIYFHLDSDAKGVDYGCPFSTMFHESAHAIDKALGDKIYGNGKHYSTAWRNGALHEAIKKDVMDYIEATHKELKEHWDDDKWWESKDIKGVDYHAPRKYNVVYGNPTYKKDYAYKYVSAELTALDQMNHKLAPTISDSYGGATRNKARNDWGHSAKYYQDSDKLEREFVANYLSDCAVNQEAIKTIEKYFPTASKLFAEMMDDMSKGVKA